EHLPHATFSKAFADFVAVIDDRARHERRLAFRLCHAAFRASREHPSGLASVVDLQPFCNHPAMRRETAARTLGQPGPTRGCRVAGGLNRPRAAGGPGHFGLGYGVFRAFGLLVLVLGWGLAGCTPAAAP